MKKKTRMLATSLLSDVGIWSSCHVIKHVEPKLDVVEDGSPHSNTRCCLKDKPDTFEVVVCFLFQQFYLASVQPFSEFGEGGQSSESESVSPSAMYGRMVAQGVAAPPLWCSPRLVEDK